MATYIFPFLKGILILCNLKQGDVILNESSKVEFNGNRKPMEQLHAGYNGYTYV